MVKSLLAARCIELNNYIEMGFIFDTVNNYELSIFWYRNKKISHCSEMIKSSITTCLCLQKAEKKFSNTVPDSYEKCIKV